MTSEWRQLLSRIGASLGVLLVLPCPVRLTVQGEACAVPFAPAPPHQHPTHPRAHTYVHAHAHAPPPPKHTQATS
jgi:hypothetical protein